MADDKWLGELRAEVRASSALAVARRLRVPRSAVVAALAGTGREHSMLVVRERFVRGPQALSGR